MYCFYRGIYYLEKKDYYMTSYFYCMPIQIGLKAKNGKLIKSGSMSEIKGDKSLEKVFMELEDR